MTTNALSEREEGQGALPKMSPFHLKAEKKVCSHNIRLKGQCNIL